MKNYEERSHVVLQSPLPPHIHAGPMSTDSTGIREGFGTRPRAQRGGAPPNSRSRGKTRTRRNQTKQSTQQGKALGAVREFAYELPERILFWPGFPRPRERTGSPRPSSWSGLLFCDYESNRDCHCRLVTSPVGQAGLRTGPERQLKWEKIGRKRWEKGMKQRGGISLESCLLRMSKEIFGGKCIVVMNGHCVGDVV